MYHQTYKGISHNHLYVPPEQNHDFLFVDAKNKLHPKKQTHTNPTISIAFPRANPFCPIITNESRNLIIFIN
jgi:hypothetical protein